MHLHDIALYKFSILFYHKIQVREVTVVVVVVVATAVVDFSSQNFRNFRTMPRPGKPWDPT